MATRKQARTTMQGTQEQEPEKGGMPTGEMGASGPESRMTSSATSAMSPLDQPSTHEMPSRGAGVGNGSAHPDANGTLAEMPGGGMAAEFEEHGSERVLVELRVPARVGAAEALQMAGDVGIQGFELDAAYDPVPVSGHADAGAAPAAADEQVVIVRGTVQPDKRAELEAQPNVIKVWDDTPIAPFVAPAFVEAPTETADATGVEEQLVVVPMDGFATCPIGTCDCSPETAKGAMADVAAYLGVDQIWAGGIRGSGIVVGVVDGGITAVGRPVKAGETSTAKVGRVIGGYPTADWGTTAAAWSNHGNMTSTDVLGMAPEAQVYDIRISDGSFISAALAGFQWAIDQHRANGTPQILSNSWGIFQESWDSAYARDPNHPFTRKVVDALNEGIIILFAAGNCGATCPDGRCGTDSGPGKDIWGANGHPRVMTVGAVNKNEQFVGYSSQGPAALDATKPDFCSVTHFQGYFASDSGTSAATPIAAGVVALIKQASPAAGQDVIKQALIGTAKDIGDPGWDPHSGAGIIRAKAAFDRVSGALRTSGPIVSWGTNRLDAFVLGTNRALYHKWWNGSAWGPSVSGWETMGGVCTSPPTVASWGANRLDAFVVGTDRALYHKWWNGSAWGPAIDGYEYMGGVCMTTPAVAAWGPNRLDVFVLGTDRALYHKWWNGSAWGPSVTGWESLGGVCQSPPTVVSWGPNRLDIFVTGIDSQLYHKWWDGSAWGPSVTGWEAMGGAIIGQPEVVSWGPNRLDVFVVGTDSQLYHKWWNGSAWGPSLTGYEAMGGTIVGHPEAVAWGANRLDVFVTGVNSALYHKWWNGSAWGPSLTGYESLGGAMVGHPEAVAWGPNRLDVFVTGTDSALYHKWWNGSAWGPSVAGWESLGGVIAGI